MRHHARIVSHFSAIDGTSVNKCRQSPEVDEEQEVSQQKEKLAVR